MESNVSYIYIRSESSGAEIKELMCERERPEDGEEKFVSEGADTNNWDHLNTLNSRFRLNFQMITHQLIGWLP